MIARKLLWIVEICWGTASNFRTCKVRHSTSSSLFSSSLYFPFSLTVVPLMILLSWFKFVNVLHIYLFISNDCTGLYKKKLFNWIIERIKLCDCVFSIFVMPPVRTQFVTTQKKYWVRMFKGRTISFVERGLERLGLGHWTAVSHGFYRNLHEGELDVSSKTFFWCSMSGSGL